LLATSELQQQIAATKKERKQVMFVILTDYMAQKIVQLTLNFDKGS